MIFLSLSLIRCNLQIALKLPRSKARNNGSSDNSGFHKDDKLICEANSTVKSLVNKIYILTEKLRVNKEKFNQVDNDNNQLK